MTKSRFHIAELSEAVTDLRARIDMHAASYTSSDAYASLHVPRMMKRLSHDVESSLSRLLALKESTSSVHEYRVYTARVQSCVSKLDDHVHKECPELRTGATKEAIERSKACADRSMRSIDVLRKRQSSAFVPSEIPVLEVGHLLKRRGSKGKLTAIQLDYIVREHSRGASIKKIAFSIGRSKSLVSQAIESAAKA